MAELPHRPRPGRRGPKHGNRVPRQEAVSAYLDPGSGSGHSGASSAHSGCAASVRSYSLRSVRKRRRAASARSGRPACACTSAASMCFLPARTYACNRLSHATRTGPQPALSLPLSLSLSQIHPPLNRRDETRQASARDDAADGAGDLRDERRARQRLPRCRRRGPAL
jgi:hypothetical protein